MDSIFPERLTGAPDSARTKRPISRLPEDILRDGVNRLGSSGLFYSITFLLAWLGPSLVIGQVRLEFFLEPRSLVSIASISLGVVIYFLARAERIAPERLMDLGLVFLVVSTWGISMANFWGAFPRWYEGILGEYTGIPWECVWIIVFPLLAPNKPVKSLLASLAAASTAPLTLLLSMAFGLTSPEAPFGLLFVYFLFTTYLCAGIAFVTSRGVYSIGTRLKEARDLGSYKLVRQLGSGGMGEVWIAEHRMLARPAAIKLIRPEMLGPNDAGRRTVLQRFQREAQATAALHSYHTISLYDFGVTRDGSFYYVMELLDGLNLDELIKIHGPISSARAVYLLGQVCHSLADAHESGMIHRDIKPANIFLSRLGSEHDFVKVLDFGLVKTPEGLSPGATELTLEGMAYGTPGFMAPEIAMGKTDLDGRVDVYGVGCVAYWLLTGQRVFKGETPMAEAIHHVHSKPEPPSERTQVAIPAALEELVLTCLEKEPADRPQTAADLGRLLADSIDAELWTNEQAKQWWEVHMPSLDAGIPEPAADQTSV